MKGGVGKSATSHALGVALARLGLRTLMIDMDPQSTLTQAAHGTVEDAQKNMVGVIGGRVKAANTLLKIDENLALLPSDIELATMELELVAQMGRENVLKRALKPLHRYFDVAIIDTAPSLGLLAVNALTAGDGVLIPTQPQVADLRGLKLFLGTLDKVRDRLNPDLQTLGVLITFYDGRLIHHRDAIDVLKESDLPLLPIQIGRSIRVAEAAAAGESIITYDPTNKQAIAYQTLAQGVEKWLKSAQR